MSDRPVRVRCIRERTQPRSLCVLFVHGLASNATIWDHGVELGVQGHEVWTADLPWSREGHPGWAETVDTAMWLSQAVAEVPGRVDVVVAHSFAASLLLDLATRPGAEHILPGIQGLVFVSPFYRPRTTDFTWDTLHYYLDGFGLIMAEGIRIAAAGRHIDEDIRIGMANRVLERVGAYGWVRFFDSYLRTPHLDVDRIEIPCCVISGADDRAATPSDSHALNDVLRDSRVYELNGCGHFPMAEQPQKFADLLDRFCTSLTVDTMEAIR